MLAEGRGRCAEPLLSGRSETARTRAGSKGLPRPRCTQRWAVWLLLGSTQEKQQWGRSHRDSGLEPPWPGSDLLQDGCHAQGSRL